VRSCQATKGSAPKSLSILAAASCIHRCVKPLAPLALVSNLHSELVEEEMSRAKGCLGAASVLALLFGVAGWLLR
jgi:hypothetical protein